MSQKQFTLKASLAGAQDQLILNLLWGILFLIGTIWSWSSVNTTVAELSAIAGNDLGYIETFKTLKHGDNIWFLLKGIAGIITALLTFVAVMELIQCFYNAKSVNHIDLERKTIKENTYGFPFSAKEESLRFDRIVETEVHQTSLQRLFNIGTLTITILRDENFDAKEKGWIMKWLENPGKKKRELDELLSVEATQSLRVAPKA